MGVGSVDAHGCRVVRLAALPRAAAHGRRMRFAARLRAAVPGVAVERRYGVVLDALALRLPVRALARVERLPGVAGIYPVAKYHPLADTVPGARRRRAALGRRPLDRGRRASRSGSSTTASTRPRPFLRPAGLHAPPGFPLGQRRFTTGRVIVARSFAGPGRARRRPPRLRPRRLRARHARLGHRRRRLRHRRAPRSRAARRARSLGRRARRLARQLPRARARRSRERRDRLDRRARGRRRPGGRGRHGRAQPLARRPADRPVGRRALDGARERGGARACRRSSRPATTSTRAATARSPPRARPPSAITVAATSTTRVFGVSGPRQRRQRPRARAVHRRAVDRDRA